MKLHKIAAKAGIALLALSTLTCVVPSMNASPLDAFVAEAKAAKPKLNKKSITLSAGQSMKLTVKNGKVKKWTSSRKKVASVSGTGKVTAKKKGTAKITAVLKNGKKLTCSVTVRSDEGSSKVLPNGKIQSIDSINIINGLLYGENSGKYSTTMNCLIEYPLIWKDQLTADISVRGIPKDKLKYEWTIEDSRILRFCDRNGHEIMIGNDVCYDKSSDEEPVIAFAGFGETNVTLTVSYGNIKKSESIRLCVINKNTGDYSHDQKIIGIVAIWRHEDMYRKIYDGYPFKIEDFRLEWQYENYYRREFSEEDYKNCSFTVERHIGGDEGTEKYLWYSVNFSIGGYQTTEDVGHEN